MAIYSAFYEASNTSITMGLAVFPMVLILSLMISAFCSAIICAVAGIPIYYFLRNLGFTNGILITCIGVFIAYIFALVKEQDQIFTVWYCVYGGASAFFFWLGAKHASDEKSASEDTSEMDD